MDACVCILGHGSIIKLTQFTIAQSLFSQGSLQGFPTAHFLMDSPKAEARWCPDMPGKSPHLQGNTSSSSSFSCTLTTPKQKKKRNPATGKNKGWPTWRKCSKKQTPWKINGWNLQPSPNLERKMIWTKPPSLWSMLIFQGDPLVSEAQRSSPESSQLQVRYIRRGRGEVDA